MFLLAKRVMIEELMMNRKKSSTEREANVQLIEKRILKVYYLNEFLF